MVSLSGSNLSKWVSSAESTAVSSDIHILDKLFFQVKSGESVAITGASGSGKSTLLGLMAGLDLPSAGELFFNEQPLHALDEEARTALRAQYAGFVFQQFYLIPHLTAIENVLIPYHLLLQQQGRHPENLALFEKAEAVLEAVGLGHRLQHLPNQLSGGEQQRVAIARAFILEPQILFADEPTGNLDTHTGKSIIDLLFKLREAHQSTLIFVTHDLSLSARCDKTWRLSGGKLDCGL